MPDLEKEVITVAEPRADRELALEVIERDGEEVRELEATADNRFIDVLAALVKVEWDRKVLATCNFG